MKNKSIDKELIKEGARKILQGIGENINREGLKDTPKRVANFWEEFLSYKEVFPVSFSSNYDEMIIVRNISFYSICEHHLLPFIGEVGIGYIPKKGKVLGLSKLVRVVYKYSHRLQIQERMTQEIGKEIERLIKPEGVGVWVKGKHLCMAIRGVKNVSSEAVTIYLSGVFREKQKTREEFLKNVMGGNNV